MLINEQKHIETNCLTLRLIFIQLSHSLCSLKHPKLVLLFTCRLFRCTLNAIPNSQAMQSKLKLPFGLIIHPFKDLSSLPVISAGVEYFILMDHKL